MFSYLYCVNEGDYYWGTSQIGYYRDIEEQCKLSGRYLDSIHSSSQNIKKNGVCLV